VVAPQEGYGEHDSRGLQEVRRDAFPDGFQPAVGMELTAQGPQGEPVPFTIREVKLESVVIDLNHPLAGKTLHFDVTVREVRTATAEELEHGHAHGPDGHDH
jgi:FKBP-type peptidyl-prolyl cis-trans isomerase SlyD